MSSLAAVRLVADREIRQGLRSRALRISMLLTVAVVVAITALPAVLGGDDETRFEVGLVAPEGRPAPPAGEVADALPALARAADVTVAVVPLADRGAAEEALRRGDVDAVLDGGTVVAESAPPAQLEAVLARAAAVAEQQRRAAAAGLSAEQRALLFAPTPPLAVQTLDDPDEPDPGAFAVAAITVIALFMALTFYGAAVLNGVLQEKSSRVVEVVLSTVTPRELLAGKILGIGLLGLGQVAILGTVAFVSIAVVGDAELPATTAPTIGLAVVWFILGYALYSSLYAMAGALVSRQEEAQAAGTPVAILLTVGYVATFAVVLPSPDGFVARVLTLVPFTAPMTVLARAAVGELAAWEVLAAAVLTVAGTAALVALAARVYAGAALRFGGRVKLGQALRGSG